MLSTYHTHVSERALVGLPPLPLNAAQVAALRSEERRVGKECRL